MRFRMLAALLAAMLVGVPALAQEQSGSIQGVVKDPQGAVLPGATVEAKNPTTGATTAVTTNSGGIYRFPALPPGVYDVSATLQGFQAGKPIPAVVELGKNLAIDIVLSLAGVQESVTVTSESSPLIDTKANATYATITKETIERIPKGRDFATILRQAPGAQQESKAGNCGAACAIQIDGASGSENRFIIDGMDTTNLRDGRSGKTMLLDFVDEVVVKSSGYNAEFGGATGGVVNVVTKSGNNAFHGQAGTYYTNDGWDGKRRPSLRFNPFDSNVGETGLVTRDDGQQYYSPLGDVGGPIFKSRLWFYGSGAYTKTNNERDAIFRTDITKTNRHFEWWSDTKYLNYKVTNQISNNLRLMFSGSNQRNANRGTAPTLQPDNALPIPANSVYPSGVPSLGMTTSTFDANADGSINQTAFNNRWVNQGGNQLNDVYTANADWVIRPTFFVNVSAGSYHTDDTTPAEFRGNQIRHNFGNANSDSVMTAAGFPTVPSQFQQPNGYNDVISSSGRVRDIYTRRFFNANATVFKTMLGQHAFKTGMRFERFANDVLDGNAQPVIELHWGQKYTDTNGVTQAGRYGYYIVNQTGTIGQVHSNNYAFWVQDSWDIHSRVTLNLGVRAENEYIPSYKDKTEFPDALDIKFKFKDKIAPRLGFAYDIKGNGKWKAFGSYGWYYDITKLELPRGSFGGDHWVNYYWTLETADFSTIQCGEGPTGCPGRYLESVDFRHSSNQIDPGFEAYFNRPGMTGIDPNLKPVKQGEWTTGLEHELRPTMSVGVRYVHKWLFRTIEDVGVFFQGPRSI
jgi:Carboxypeptidase regulatory-like domain/TonB-dependent Receptor Plug Domain